MEATPGFEPGIRALQAPALATWPRRLREKDLSGPVVGGQCLPSRPVRYSNTSENESPAIGRADFQMYWSGRRELNPRRQPWQGCTLPLSYSRSHPPMGSVNLAIAVDRVNSSPHFSPPSRQNPERSADLVFFLHSRHHPLAGEDECHRRDHRDHSVDEPHDLGVGRQAGLRPRDVRRQEVGRG